MEANRYDAGNETELPVLVLSQDGVNLAAFWARILAGCGFNKSFNPVYVMENLVAVLDPSFNYQIIEEAEWEWNFSIHAFYDALSNRIAIRSDVYTKALEGDIVASSTITHELCHYFQFVVLNFLTTVQCLEYKSELCTKDSVQMRNQEIQTDSITFLILKPDELFAGKSDEEIFDFYIAKPIVKALGGLVKAAGREFLPNMKALPFCQETKSEVPCAV